MAYCTIDDLKKRIPYDRIIELTDDNADGVPDTGVVDECISHGDSEIDAACGMQYTVPFTAPAPALIRRCSIDMAAWFMYSRRVNQSIPDAVRKRYEDAMQRLKDLSEATITLPDATPASRRSSMVQTKKTADDRVFSDDTLRDY